MRRFRNLWPALLIALIFQGIESWWLVSYNNTMYLSEMIIKNGLCEVSMNVSSIITNATEKLLPVFLFELLYGTLIYRSFCNVSVYYFSRQYNRTTWFCRKCVRLYLVCLVYEAAKVVISCTIACSAGLLQFDSAGILLCLYKIFSWSLWIFAMALGVNLIAIRWTSVGGFFSIFCVQLLSMSSLVLFTDDLVMNSGNLIPKILFHLNPFAQICIAFQKSSNVSIQNQLTEYIINGNGILDINYSLIYCLAMAVIIMLAGCMIVRKHEFLTANTETGGN